MPLGGRFLGGGGYLGWVSGVGATSGCRGWVPGAALTLAGGAGGPVGGRLQAVLRDLDIAHDAFARRDGAPSPPEPPITPPAPAPAP